jgi:hypothetical protein
MTVRLAVKREGNDDEKNSFGAVNIADGRVRRCGHMLTGDIKVSGRRATDSKLRCRERTDSQKV